LSFDLPVFAVRHLIYNRSAQNMVQICRKFRGIAIFLRAGAFFSTDRRHISRGGLNIGVLTRWRDDDWLVQSRIHPQTEIMENRWRGRFRSPQMGRLVQPSRTARTHGYITPAEAEEVFYAHMNAVDTVK